MKQEKGKNNHTYFYKVKKELEKLRKNLKLIPAWKIEIEVITKKMSAYRDGRISLISSNKTITIDDILERDETRINILESNIEYTSFKLNEYKAYLEVLDDDEYEVINRKYLDIENKRTSYRRIGEDMHCARMTVKRLHDSAIEKIGNYKYKNTEKIEDDTDGTNMGQTWDTDGTKNMLI